MQTFRPGRPPAGIPQAVSDYLADLEGRIQKAAAADSAYTNNKVLHAAPARYFPGMEVYADGVDWNPGSGEGKYRRNAANTAWVFIG